MKKFTKYATSLALCLLATVSCSKDYLETAPTTSVSGQTIFDNASTAMAAVNGIYSAMHKSRWSATGNLAQCQGINGATIAAEVMGDDMIMSAKGSGWFWEEHRYAIKIKWTTTTWREYDLWNQFYTYIANANYIIAAKDDMAGSAADVNYVVGQAYAIRGYSYYLLAQWFARTYKGHESDPCVPVYTEPSVAGTQGKPRSSVQEVYDVITSDLDTAIARLQNSYAHTSVSHIDYSAANGLRTRVALTMEDWQTAANCAAVARANTKVGDSADIVNGMNSVATKNVIWGIIFTDADRADSPYFYQEQMFGHFDKNGTHGKKAMKYATPQLYNMMSATDVRRAWWSAVADRKVSGGYHYQQEKFRYADITTFEGDIALMRNEEMLLSEAEAQCRLGNEAQARTLLMELMAKRDPNYSCTKTGCELAALTNTKTGSLLEEIINQRRIELWGEAGRIFDIRRLKQGFTREASQGYNSLAVSAMIGNVTNPESYAWVLPIPQKEFDSNPCLSIDKDQNPLDDGI